MGGGDVTTRWIVTMQHRIQGEWVDPLPGMDRFHATCWTRKDARELRRLYLPAKPGQRFVVRKEAAT